MNIDYWIQVLRQDADAIHSFQQYLQHNVSESSKQFQTAKSMEQVSKLQGHIETLSKISNDFNRQQLKESEDVAYTRTQSQPAGT